MDSLRKRTVRDYGGPDSSRWRSLLSVLSAAGRAVCARPAPRDYQGGEVEGFRAEYQAHHPASDIAFLKTAKVDLVQRSGNESGDTAWVNSDTGILGKSSKGRDIDVLSIETVLLRKTPEGWQIKHLRWSSANYKGGAS